MQRDRDQSQERYTLRVGPNAKFKTLKAAVDYFNAWPAEFSIGTPCRIVLDAGLHSITDTITVNATHSAILVIEGAGNASVIAATGLTNKPMFNIETGCVLKGFNLVGTFLASWGTQSTENLINLNQIVYVEVVDCDMYGGYHSIHDVAGASLFLFNCIIDTPVASGVHVNYGGASALNPMYDIEVANFVNCPIGIHLETNNSEGSTVYCAHVIFMHSTTETAILYVPATFKINTMSQFLNCSYNDTGTFFSGFDFSRADARDAGVVVMGCAGAEDKKPHCKVNVVDSTATTTLTTAGTYYKLNFNSKKTINFDVAATAGAWTITIGDQTTASLDWNISAANLQTAINNLSNVTSATVTQIVASKTWTIQFNTAGEGWIDMMPVVNLGTLATTTSAEVTPDTYSCKCGITNNRVTMLSPHKQDMTVMVCGSIASSQAARTVTIGIKKGGVGMPMGPMSVRLATQDVFYPFSTIVYLEDILHDEYFELWASSLDNNNVVTLSDLQIFAYSM